MENLENMRNLSGTIRYWYALYTRPRFEKKVDNDLKERGLESFLPIHAEVRTWSDRIKKIETPVFPSYVFVNANSRERYISLQPQGVVRMVSFNGQPASIPEEQIERIHRIIKFGYDPVPHQYLRFGDEVEIVTGPLHGLYGFYVEERGQNRIIISIDAIQQSIAIEVERGQVQRVNSAE